MTNVLLAEDDEFLARGIALALEDSGYNVDCTRSGNDADHKLAVNEYDLVILDLGLPKLDGIEVLSRLRARGATVPVLVLTARDSVQAKVQGLDAGANDYLIKPFELLELEARIRALLRGRQWNNRIDISFGSITFDTVNRQPLFQNKPIDLSAREVDVLEILLQAAGRIVPRRRLLDKLSDWDAEMSNNALEIVVHRLRKKLEFTGTTIRTVRGLGYLIETAKDEQ